jgi:hypothetical protein
VPATVVGISHSEVDSDTELRMSCTGKQMSNKRDIFVAYTVIFPIDSH